MSHLNKNISINFLQEFVTHNINSQLDYLPEKFNEEQRYTLEVFKKRVFLEEPIEETISFNRSLNWDNKYSNTNLALSAEELIKVFKLKSSVYHEISYQKECLDEIDGLNFDTFDKNSAVIYCKNNNEISGTIRLIFDSKKGLPSE